MNQADKEAWIKACEEWRKNKGSGLGTTIESQYMFEAALAHARSGDAVGVTTVAQIEAMKNGYSRTITARDPSFVQFPDDNDVTLFTHSQPDHTEQPLEMVSVPEFSSLADAVNNARRTARLMHNAWGHEVVCIEPHKWDAIKKAAAHSPAVAQGGEVNKELLEVLQNLVDRDFTFFNNKMVGCSKSIMRADVLKAREAINKAEGNHGL